MRKLISILLSGAIALTAAAGAPAAAFTAPAVIVNTVNDSSGQLTSTMNYTLSGGVLTIYGSGDMPNWENYNYLPWKNETGGIRAIVIGEGVTSVGRGAFYECSGVSSVTLPSTIKNIYAYAFYGCSSLGSVNIPASCELIAGNSFAGCNSLRSAVINNPNCRIVAGTAFGLGVTLYGHSGSTAQEYARVNNLGFADIGQAPQQQDPPVTAPPATAPPAQTTTVATDPPAPVTTTTAKPVVTDPLVISVTPPKKTTYNIGEALDLSTGSIVIIETDMNTGAKKVAAAKMKDGDGITIDTSSFNSNVPGVYEIRITCTRNGATVTSSFQVTVSGTPGETTPTVTTTTTTSSTTTTTTTAATTTAETTEVTLWDPIPPFDVETISASVELVSPPSRTTFTVGEKFDIYDFEFRIDASARYTDGGYESGSWRQNRDNNFMEAMYLDHTNGVQHLGMLFLLLTDDQSIDYSRPGTYQLNAKVTDVSGTVVYAEKNFDIVYNAPQTTEQVIIPETTENPTTATTENHTTETTVNLTTATTEVYTEPAVTTGAVLNWRVFDADFELVTTPVKKTYRQDEHFNGFDLSGMQFRVAKHYQDGTGDEEALVSYDQYGADINFDVDYKVSGFDINTPGKQTVSVTVRVSDRKGSFIDFSRDTATFTYEVEVVKGEVTPPAEEFRPGDVNDDGMVDSTDATALLEEYARTSTGGDPTFTEKQKKAADVNGDGMCDSSDASGILSYYAYVSTTSDAPPKSMKEHLAGT